MVAVARGECPKCGMPIPFGQTIRRRGQPFACQGCRSSLILEKPNIFLLMGLLTVALLIIKWGGVAAFLAVAVIIALGDWKLARARIADGRSET